MPVIDDICDSNKQHQPESRIETEKECQGKNEHKLVVPEPKTNLNGGIQESRIDLTPKETVTLQTEYEQLKYANSSVTNNTTDSVPNERSKLICRPPAYLKDNET